MKDDFFHPLVFFHIQGFLELSEVSGYSWYIKKTFTQRNAGDVMEYQKHGIPHNQDHDTYPMSFPVVCASRQGFSGILILIQIIWKPFWRASQEWNMPG